MRYLVTGGLGLIGSHLCTALINAGHEVLCMDSCVIGREENLNGVRGNPRLFIDYHDASHKFDCGPVAGIFHLASPMAPVETYKHPEMTIRVNSDGVLNVIHLAKKYKARLVYASSVKVKDTLHFGAAYISGKILGEAFCLAEGFPAIARMGNIYGPGMARDDSRVIPTFCRRVRDGEPISVWGDGQQVDSFCYVSDAVDALIELMNSQYSGVFEIGSPDGITIYDLALEVIAATRAEVPIVFDSPGGAQVVACNNIAHANSRTAESTKKKSRKVPEIGRAIIKLGWRPTIPLRDGILNTFKYYQEVEK